MRKLFLLIIPAFLLMPGCGKREAKVENPFFVEWDTPFGVPPFDKIANEHFLPAYQEAISQHKVEIDAIINNPEEPTFENTIVAFDQAGELLNTVGSVFGGLRGAHTNDTLQQIARETTPMLSAHSNEIRMNQVLFGRIKAVYDKRETLALDLEQMRLVEKIYQDFERGGAALPEAQREELKKLNERMSMVTLQLGENVLKENNGFKLIIDNEADLAGLPQNVIDAAANMAKRDGHEGKWVFDLSRPSWTPFLTFSERRDLREKLFRAFYMRGNNDNENDNKALFAELMQLRQQASRLLRFENFAEFTLSINMAQTPGNVYNFLQQVWEPALKRAKGERDDMQRIVNREGGNFTLESWDWWYYAEKVRKEKFDLDENEIRPYFAINNVRDGAFYVSNRLYGLTFKKRDDIPVYHKEVEVFEVIDYDGSTLAVLYIDPHPRPSKRSGAWCGTFRSGSYKDGERIIPLVTIVMNFSPPTADKPALLSWDEVETYWHEFGHALHNFFADGKYRRTARSVPRDFVELPAQVMENWAGEPEVLKVYARHYQTGEQMPDELISKLTKSLHFNQGFINTEFLASAFIDMDWHTANHSDKIDVNAFEEATIKRIGLINQIVPRHRTTNFGHIHGTGYAAGYYVYMWAGVLDADAFYAFKESGDLFNQELAARFRKYVHAKNSLYEGMDAYVRFRGKEPGIEGLLKQRGLY